MPWQGETYEYRRFAGQSLMELDAGWARHGYDKVLSGHILGRQTSTTERDGDGIKGQGIMRVRRGAFARDGAPRWIS